MSHSPLFEISPLEKVIRKYLRRDSYEEDSYGEDSYEEGLDRNLDVARVNAAQNSAKGSGSLSARESPLDTYFNMPDLLISSRLGCDKNHHTRGGRYTFS